MVTWPLFAEQFLNERLVARVLKIGVRIGVEVLMSFVKEEIIGLLVKDEDVKRAIEKLMQKNRRIRARKPSRSARPRRL